MSETVQDDTPPEQSAPDLKAGADHADRTPATDHEADALPVNELPVEPQSPEEAAAEESPEKPTEPAATGEPVEVDGPTEPAEAKQATTPDGLEGALADKDAANSDDARSNARSDSRAASLSGRDDSDDEDDIHLSDHESGAGGADDDAASETASQSQAAAMPLAEQQEEIEAHLSLLEAEMRSHEARAEYMQAEKIRLKIQDLKKKHTPHGEREFLMIQMADKARFEQFAQQELQAFDQEWNDKFSERETKARASTDRLRERHEEQQRELYESLEKKSVVPKYSAEYYTIRNKQVALAKVQRYVEAEKMRKRGDKMQAELLDRMRRRLKEDHQAKFHHLLSRQETEKETLREKLLGEKQLLEHMKDEAFSLLLKRLRAAELKMKREQRSEKVRLQKSGVAVFDSQERSTTKPKLAQRLKASALQPKGAKTSGKRKGHKPNVRELAAMGRSEQ